jgi:hypothetical protein
VPAVTAWRDVADALYARLVIHDYCDEGHVELVADCPFCADRAACKLYRDSGGRLRAREYPDAHMVPISEILPTDGDPDAAHVS